MSTTEVETPVMATPVPVALNASHRCARCAAQAIVRTEHPTLGDFDWCKHHFERNEDGLTLAGFAVTIDNRKDLR